MRVATKSVAYQTSFRHPRQGIIVPETVSNGDASVIHALNVNPSSSVSGANDGMPKGRLHCSQTLPIRLGY